MRSALIAGLLLTATAYPVFAQQSEGSSDRPVLIEIDEADRLIPGFNVSVKELRDMDVFGANSEKIGEIEECWRRVTARSRP
ncbi:hypothetical protein [Nitratireductor luteus]|uniref:hypothetical protein n=1 Tax=Nitratireductor luteus TaxID=2976980 RepID=UPI00223FF091|nr:hypothetical protein [Nitratireductor luteus]